MKVMSDVTLLEERKKCTKAFLVDTRVEKREMSAFLFHLLETDKCNSCIRRSCGSPTSTLVYQFWKSLGCEMLVIYDVLYKIALSTLTWVKRVSILNYLFIYWTPFYEFTQTINNKLVLEKYFYMGFVG